MPSYFLSANRESVQQDPYVFQLKDGSLVGLWSDLHLDPGPEGHFGVYRRGWSGDLRMAWKTDMPVPNLTNDIQHSSVGTGFANGNYAVIFESRGPSAIDGTHDGHYDSYIRFFRSNGAPIGLARQLTPNTAVEHYAADIATLTNGQSVALIARYEEAGHYDLLAYRHNARGEQIGKPVRLVDDAEVYVNSWTGAGYVDPSITASSEGGYAVSWHQETEQGDLAAYSVWVQVHDAEGRAIGPARVVTPMIRDENSHFLGLDQESAEIAGRSIGGFAIAWNREEGDDSLNSDVYFRLLDRAGAAKTPMVLVNSAHRSGEQTLQDVVDLGAGRILVTYFHQIPYAIDDVLDGGVLYGRVFGPDGWPLMDSFRISEGEPYASMGAGNTIINHQGRIVSTFQAELSYGTSDDVIIASRALTLPVVSAGRAGNPLQGTYVNDHIRGNDGNDTISGNRGDDRLLGGSGHDLVSGGGGADAIRGDGGNDRLLGDAGNDTIHGGPGQDRIRGGSGNDLHEGGDGHDLLWGDAGSDRMRGDSGNDMVQSGLGDDVLAGGAGGDTLIGGAGADRMGGGTGNDVYFADARDTIIEGTGGGVDTMRASYSARLAANVENLVLEGRADLDGTGNGIANWLYGNDGRNILSGGAGDDTYVIGRGDTVRELAGQGFDMVRAAFGLTLGANVEGLTLLGAAGLLGTGNGLANRIIGNAGANRLSGLDGADSLWGGAGNDTLSGGRGNDALRGDDGHDLLTGADGGDLLVGAKGNDSLSGGAGADRLIGGVGVDLLTGGAGADVFVFAAVAESRPGSGHDRIADFAHGIDHVDLEGIDANTRLAGDQDFAFSGSRGAAHSVWLVTQGSSELIRGDVNGDRIADFEIVLANTHAAGAGDLLI